MVVALTTTSLLTFTLPPEIEILAGEVKLAPVRVTAAVVTRRPEFRAMDVWGGFGCTGALTVKETPELCPPLVATVTLRSPVASVDAITKVAVIWGALTTF